MTDSTLTPAHFGQIRAFLGARIAEATDPPGGPTTPAGRVAAALEGAVGRAARRATGFATYVKAGPDEQRAIAESILDAWAELASIALTGWSDHPDFLPEFARISWKLPNAGEAEEGSR